MAGGSLLPGGGGIGLTGANITLSDNLIAGNHSTGQGGGLLLNGSNLHSIHNRYVGNTTTGSGGGILIEGTCVLSFHGDSILNNSAASNGGGLFAYGQSGMTIDRVIFFSNAAKWGGGLDAVYSTLPGRFSCQRPWLMEMARPVSPKLSQACKNTRFNCWQKPPVGLPSL